MAGQPSMQEKQKATPIPGFRAGREERVTSRAWLGSRTALLGATVIVGTAAAGPWNASARGQAASPRVTLLDQRAPGLFDSTTQPLRGLEVRYRLDARVLLPLGFGAVPLWSRPDVGWVDASYRDRATDDGAVVRGYELFASSRPERARGLNRLGFFREALRLTGDGVEWTAYFGTMSASGEKSYSEATKAVEPGQPHVYDVTDGLAAPLLAQASIFNVPTEARAATASELYAILRPHLGQPRRTPSATGSPARPLPALAFLGALQASLARAADSAAPLKAKGLRVGFVHNGIVKQLEISGIRRDPRRAGAVAGSGFVRNANDVYSLDYRITSSEGTDGTFKIWGELPSSRPDLPGGPIAPLAWEFQPRSFLRIYAERMR